MSLQLQKSARGKKKEARKTEWAMSFFLEKTPKTSQTHFFKKHNSILLYRICFQIKTGVHCTWLFILIRLIRSRVSRLFDLLLVFEDTFLCQVYTQRPQNFVRMPEFSDERGK